MSWLIDEFYIENILALLRSGWRTVNTVLECKASTATAIKGQIKRSFLNLAVTVAKSFPGNGSDWSELPTAPGPWDFVLGSSVWVFPDFWHVLDKSANY